MKATLNLMMLIGISAAGYAAMIADGAYRDRLVAQSDTGKVLYRMIACDDHLLSAADCHACEQQRLARRIHQKWIATAAKMYSVVLTTDEQAIVAQKISAEEGHFRAAAAHFHALASAALDIRCGKDRTALLPELAKQGVTPQELDLELLHLPTIADAERAAATDYVSATRESAREYNTRLYVLQHLQAIVRKRALDERVPLDVAEESFWSEIARAIHTRIVDPAFSMPERKGILVSP